MSFVEFGLAKINTTTDEIIEIISEDNGVYLMHYELTLVFGTFYVIYCECNQSLKRDHWFWKWCQKLTSYSVFFETQLLLCLSFSGWNTELRDTILSKSMPTDGVVYWLRCLQAFLYCAVVIAKYGLCETISDFILFVSMEVMLEVSVEMITLSKFYAKELLADFVIRPENFI